MAHPLCLSSLSRILLVLILAAPSLAASPALAQEAPTNWQPFGVPGGRLTHVASGPDGDLYAVSVVSVNRKADQTQWRDTGAPARADALYTSRDGGASWQAATNDLPPGELTALYVDYLGSVWVGVQTRSAGLAAGNGLWRSDDRGATWREVLLGRNDLIIRTITEDSGKQILVGAVDTGGLEQGLIYRSAGDGASWTSQSVSVPNQASSVRLARLVPHPSKEGILFVLATDGVLLRSTDDGESWQAAAGIESSPTGSAQLQFLPGLTDTAILLQAQGTSLSVKRSTDAGATWSEVRATGLPSGPVELRSMLALPRNVLLVNTDGGTYRSADGGRGWQPLEGALSSGNVGAWTVQGTPGEGVLAATDYGLFRSSDSGAIWQAFGNGLPVNSGVAGLLTHKDRPTLIAASLRAADGADPPELVLSRDGGRTWLPADDGGAWHEATAWAIDPNNPDNLYVAGKDYVAASRDGGFSWQVHQVPNSEGAVRRSIVVAPSDSKRVYVDGAPAMTSDDGGRTWRELAIDQAENAALGLAVDPADASHIWAGSSSGVRESRDGGRTWQRAGLDGRAVAWLVAAGDGTGASKTVLYAGLREGGIMRYAMATSDWQPADAGLPPRSVITAFVADPRALGLLWASRDGGGVYRSTDGGEDWANVGTGLGENLGLALAVNYEAPGGVLLGTATAGVWGLGSNNKTPQATETPARSPTSAPGGRGDRTGIDARIEVVWPHGFAGIDQARLANVGIRLFAARSLQPPACGWQPDVQLWRAVDNEPAELVKQADQRSVDGQAFPYWDANDVDVSAGRDGTRKIYFLVAVQGIDTATSVWAHAADARTYFPEQQVPSGVATGAVDAVDARIQIVWPHDESGAEVSAGDAPLANVAVALFKHGTRLSVPSDWADQVTLYGAWNNEVARRFSTEATVVTRQAGVITYPVWEFNDVPVDRAKDKTSKLYLWAVAEGLTSYPNIWAHGADARTYFPDSDEPIQGCLP